MDAWENENTENTQNTENTEYTDREAGRTADEEAIRAAEQTVGEAWIARLMLAESETEAVLGACARARGRAAERVRAAQQSGDLVALVDAQTDLEAARTAWGHAVEDHERTRADLARELSLWSEDIARHVRRAWTEQSRAGRR